MHKDISFIQCHSARTWHETLLNNEKEMALQSQSQLWKSYEVCLKEVWGLNRTTLLVLQDIDLVRETDSLWSLEGYLSIYSY